MYEMAPRLMRNPGAQSQPDEFTLKLDDALRIAPLAVEIGQRLVEQQQLRGTMERSEPKAPIGSGSGSSTLSTGHGSPPASRISVR